MKLPVAIPEPTPSPSGTPARRPLSHRRQSSGQQGRHVPQRTALEPSSGTGNHHTQHSHHHHHPHDTHQATQHNIHPPGHRTPEESSQRGHLYCSPQSHRHNASKHPERAQHHRNHQQHVFHGDGSGTPGILGSDSHNRSRFLRRQDTMNGDMELEPRDEVETYALLENDDRSTLEAIKDLDPSSRYTLGTGLQPIQSRCLAALASALAIVALVLLFTIVPIGIYTVVESRNGGILGSSRVQRVVDGAVKRVFAAALTPNSSEESMWADHVVVSHGSDAYIDVPATYQSRLNSVLAPLMSLHQAEIWGDDASAGLPCALPEKKLVAFSLSRSGRLPATVSLQNCVSSSECEEKKIVHDLRGFSIAFSDKSSQYMIHIRPAETNIGPFENGTSSSRYLTSWIESTGPIEIELSDTGKLALQRFCGNSVVDVDRGPMSPQDTRLLTVLELKRLYGIWAWGNIPRGDLRDPLSLFKAVISPRDHALHTSNTAALLRVLEGRLGPITLESEPSAKGSGNLSLIDRYSRTITRLTSRAYKDEYDSSKLQGFSTDGVKPGSFFHSGDNPVVVRAESFVPSKDPPTSVIPKARESETATATYPSPTVSDRSTNDLEGQPVSKSTDTKVSVVNHEFAELSNESTSHGRMGETLLSHRGLEHPSLRIAPKLDKAEYHSFDNSRSVAKYSHISHVDRENDRENGKLRQAPIERVPGLPMPRQFESASDRRAVQSFNYFQDRRTLRPHTQRPSRPADFWRPLPERTHPSFLLEKRDIVGQTYGSTKRIIKQERAERKPSQYYNSDPIIRPQNIPLMRFPKRTSSDHGNQRFRADIPRTYSRQPIRRDTRFLPSPVRGTFQSSDSASSNPWSIPGKVNSNIPMANSREHSRQQAYKNSERSPVQQFSPRH
jgi:hypothetical protein